MRTASPTRTTRPSPRSRSAATGQAQPSDTPDDGRERGPVDRSGVRGSVDLRRRPRPAGPAALEVDRASAVAGNVLAFTATGLPPGVQVSAVFDDGAAGAGPFLVGADGTLAGVITLPAATGAGTHELRLFGVEDPPSVQFAVVASEVPARGRRQLPGTTTSCASPGCSPGCRGRAAAGRAGAARDPDARGGPVRPDRVAFRRGDGDRRAAARRPRGGADDEDPTETTAVQRRRRRAAVGGQQRVEQPGLRAADLQLLLGGPGARPGRGRHDDPAGPAGSRPRATSRSRSGTAPPGARRPGMGCPPTATATRSARRPPARSATTGS